METGCHSLHRLKHRAVITLIMVCSLLFYIMCMHIHYYQKLIETVGVLKNFDQELQRFVAPKEVIDELFANGQVFSQYVDPNRKVTMQTPYNPNGSMYAIEGIVSRDGRVLGKMGHSERQGENRFKNVYGEMDQKLFEAGVNYFRGGK